MSTPENRRVRGLPKLIIQIPCYNGDRALLPAKKLLQKLGSWVVRVTSSTDLRDAPSGFRAISKNAAQRRIVFNSYTYTLETIIQAGRKNMRVVCFEEYQSLATIKDARRFRSTGFRAGGMAIEFIRTLGLPILTTTQHLRLHA